MLSRADAEKWLDRWDRQQQTYIVDREERFSVIADVVQAASGRPDPLIVDLGIGPGSLAIRLLDRLPAAQIVGIDADPLLTGLARAAYGGNNRLRIVEGDLRAAGWYQALGLDRTPDAFVSTTALHWLTETELQDLYTVAGSRLNGGGLLVNGDHLYEAADRARLREVADAVQKSRAKRANVPDGEGWSEWWEAVQRAPELADLVRTRASGVAHHVDPEPTVDDHVAALAAAGFAEIGTVWQSGADRVLVAIR